MFNDVYIVMFGRPALPESLPKDSWSRGDAWAAPGAGNAWENPTGRWWKLMAEIMFWCFFGCFLGIWLTFTLPTRSRNVGEMDTSYYTTGRNGWGYRVYRINMIPNLVTRKMLINHGILRGTWFSDNPGCWRKSNPIRWRFHWLWDVVSTSCKQWKEMIKMQPILSGMQRHPSK